jgi:HEAT repeat protein
MNDFLQLAQSLTLALKALQMYTAAHPRTQESLAASHLVLDRWLTTQERLQFIVSGAKAFADGVVQDARNPHVAALVRSVSERGVGGFVFERGVTKEEYLTFLQGLVTKPQKLEEVGGLEAFLCHAGVLRIRVSQIRYQEVHEGEEGAREDQAPAFNPAPPSPAEDPLMRAIREALLSALAPPGSGPRAPGSRAGLGAGPGPSGEGGAGFLRGLQSSELGGPDPASEGGAGFLRGFQAADLSGLGPLGYELGLGDGQPTPAQLGILRQVLMGMEPEVQLSLLAGLASLPDHPAGLALAVKALAGEILAVATSSILAKGASWLHLRGPLEDILRPLPDREALVRALSSHLRSSGLDASQAEALLRRLDWEALSIEAKLVKVLEEGHLFELTLDQRLAFLRELLDLHRFDAFLRVQEVLLETLRNDRAEIRLNAAQTLAGVARWVQDPGLPPGGEGPLAEALRAHFAWEPDPPVHRWTAGGLEAMASALVRRGDLRHLIADIQALEGLCAFLEEQQPWRNQALESLRGSLAEPDLLAAAANHIFDPDRHRVVQEVYPYLEFVGAPMARHLVSMLGDENERTRRGRLVEAVRNLGPLSLPPLTEALSSPAWYLVRNTLALLSDLGNAGSVPAIAPILRHPEPRVRRAAVRALWKLGGPASEPHLVARMKDTDPETLQEILFALGQLRSEGSVAPVAEIAQDKRILEPLRVQAITTLGQIASPKAQPALADLVRRRGFFASVEPHDIRLAAARALWALGTTEAQELLRHMVEAEPRGEDREALREILKHPVTP